MKKLLFIALLPLAMIEVTGQVENVDSLVNMLNNNKLSTEEKYRLYADICYNYTLFDNQKAMYYAQAGLSHAEKVKNKSWIACFYAYMGNIHRDEGDFDEARNSYEKALKYATEAKVGHRIAYVNNALAIFYANQGQRLTALDFFLKSLAFYEKEETVDDKRSQINQITTLNNIGALNFELENYDLAIQYFKKAEVIAKEIDDNNINIQTYYYLSRFHDDILKEYQIALDYALKSLELAQNINDKVFECANLERLTSIYIKGFNDLKKAEEYANEQMIVAKQQNYPYLIRGAYNSLGTVYLEQKKYEEGEFAFLKAWEIDSIRPDLAYFINFKLGIANMYLGKKEEAAYYFEKSEKINKESINKEFQYQIADMQTKYETEKKEMRITSLEKERKMYVWLGVTGVFLAASLTIVLVLTIRNARRKQQLIATESLQEGEIGERTRISKDLHDRLGGSLSAVKIGLKNEESLQAINDKIDTCMKELREIINNVMPVSLQKLGIKGALEDFCEMFSNLHFHFFGEDMRFNPNQEYAVYCCARELVNNALKHSSATNINLQIIQSQKHVSLTVQDNGCGFDEKNVVKGYGLENIRNRVTTCRGKLDIFSAPGKGTETVIELKIINV